MCCWETGAGAIGRRINGGLQYIAYKPTLDAFFFSKERKIRTFSSSGYGGRAIFST
jgi:hypothetical protein